MKSPTPKPKMRVVKAWAVISKGKIDSAEVEGCDCASSNALGLYLRKTEAELTVWDNTKVVRCTITYHLPTTKSK